MLLDLTFTKVGRSRRPAPEPEAVRELLKASTRPASPTSARRRGGGDTTSPTQRTPNNVDKYAACIEQANGDAAKARKCADLLSADLTLRSRGPYAPPR